jgi:histidinol-phosphate aminotransferase
MNFDISKIIRPNIARLVPYSSARDEYTGNDAILLDANENPFSSQVNRYPDPHQRMLKERISGLYEVPAANIFLGNGSDEAIDLLFRAFCRPGTDEVIAIDPSYGMYEVSAGVNDIAIRKVLLNDDFSLNTKALLDAAGPKTRMMFLCSPNNPTSNLLDANEMLKLSGIFEGILVVDEAYIDFAGTNGMLDYVPDIPNLVVLRTFSKAWGMAGIRLGMAFADAPVIRILDNIKYPYNVNALTQDYAMRKISDSGEKNKWIENIISQRNRLEAEIRKFGYVKKVYPSDANFLLVKVHDPRDLYHHLREAKVIVRDRSRVSLCEGCLRITVGTPGENDRLLSLMEKYPA